MEIDIKITVNILINIYTNLNKCNLKDMAKKYDLSNKNMMLFYKKLNDLLNESINPVRGNFVAILDDAVKIYNKLKSK